MTNSDDDRDLRIILESVPGWHDAITEVTALEGGITNRSLRVTTVHGSYVVRVPGAQTEMLGINRRAEAVITVAAARAGIGPMTLCELPAFGTVISEFVDARTATAEDLREPEVLRGRQRSAAAPSPRTCPVRVSDLRCHPSARPRRPGPRSQPRVA